MIASASYDFKSVEVHGFPRKLSPELIKATFLLMSGIIKSLKILTDFNPDIVVGLGGYVSLPVAVASYLKRVPILLHEQNSVPGVANRLLARKAKAVAVSFPYSQKYFAAAKQVILTGNPVRREILISCSKTYEKFDLDPARKTVLIFGGSRGAQRINKAVIDAYPLFRDFDNLQIIHSTGMMSFESIADVVNDMQRKSDRIIYRCYPYLDHINQAYSVSDLIVCRAGATTLAEVTALGKAAILIPYPYATEDHQRKNAEYFRDAGAASMIRDEELDGRTLFEEVQRIIFNDSLLGRMSDAAHKMGQPDAAKKLAQVVFDIARAKNSPAIGA